MLKIPDDYEMCAIFRMGYNDPDMKRPSIDWRSSERKSINELAYKNTWGEQLKNS